MSVRPDPKQEHDVLYIVLDNLPSRWTDPRAAQAVAEMRQAVVRAERALAVLQEQEAGQDIAFCIRVAGLRILTGCAQEELAQAERYGL